MWGVARDPDQYRCAIAIAGVSNLRREVNDFGGAVRARLYRDQWRKMTPDFAAVSPINAIGRIKAPLLLIHGRKDVTVDHGQSARLYAAMQDAGKTDRKSAVSGQRVSVRVDLGGRRTIHNKKHPTHPPT